MKKLLGSISFFIVFPIFWLISNLPMPLLYGLSDVLCFVAYRIFKYRTKVVRTNLLAAFPEKTNKERKQIEKDFYKHLIDTLLEPLILLSCSKKKINKHARFSGTEILETYYQQNRNAIATTESTDVLDPLITVSQILRLTQHLLLDSLNLQYEHRYGRPHRQIGPSLS